MRKVLLLSLLLIALVSCGKESSVTTSIVTLTTTSTRPVLNTEAGVHSAKIDVMSFSYYVPNSVNEDTGFLLMLHGGFQTGEIFMNGTGMNDYADEYNFVVCYPSQNTSLTKSVRPQARYWNWALEDSQGGQGKEIQLLKGISEYMIETFELNREKVYVAGFSAGACESINVFENFNDIFKGFASVAGLGYRLVIDEIGAENLMATGRPTSSNYQTNMEVLPAKALVIHGYADNVVNYKNSEVIIEQATTSEYQKSEETYEGYDYQEYIGDGKCVKAYFLNDVGHVYGSKVPANYTITDNLDYSFLIADFFFEK